MESFDKNFVYKINPKKSSFLEFSKNEEKFKQISENPQCQYLISNLIRGVINGAQVVVESKVDKEGENIDLNYFSHYQDLSNVEEKEDPKLKRIEFEADNFILRNVFCDNDHRNLPKDKARELELYSNQFEHKNIVTNSLPKKINENEEYLNFNKYYFFDFGKAFVPMKLWPSGNYQDQSVMERKNKERFVREIKTFGNCYLYIFNPDDILTLNGTIKEKSDQLLANTFQDFSVFEKILKKGVIDLNDEQFYIYFKKIFPNEKLDTREEKELFMFNELRTRLELISQTIEKMSEENYKKEVI